MTLNGSGRAIGAVDEQRFEVAVVKVHRDVFGNGVFALLQRVEIANSHFRRDFVTDMQELAKMAVVVFITSSLLEICISFITLFLSSFY